MWILLFTTVVAVAICLSVAAIMLSRISQDSSLDRRTGRRELAPDAPSLSRTACLDLQAQPIRLKASDDVRLLLRRMAVLDLAPHQVNSADPLLFRELQGRCSLCPSKLPCADDLVRDAAGAQARDWREYCPNAATLTFLSGAFCASAPTG